MGEVSLYPIFIPLSYETEAALGLRRLGYTQPSEGEKIVVFNCLDLYHKSPDSSERQYKLRA